MIVKMQSSDPSRTVSWDEEFGSSADAISQVANIDEMVAGLLAYLVSFTTGEANKVVRNSGTDGLEAWRRLSNEYDPSSAMRRVTILSAVQNPPRCQSIEELGSCLENWLSKKRQYEEFSDADGVPCKVSDDSLMAGLFQLMPSSLEVSNKASKVLKFGSEPLPTINFLDSVNVHVCHHVQAYPLQHRSQRDLQLVRRSPKRRRAPGSACSHVAAKRSDTIACRSRILKFGSEPLPTPT